LKLHLQARSVLLKKLGLEQFCGFFHRRGIFGRISGDIQTISYSKGVMR
jgi:hypothetical protein